jgi:hypothetical protein
MAMLPSLVSEVCAWALRPLSKQEENKRYRSDIETGENRG